MSLEVVKNAALSLGVTVAKSAKTVDVIDLIAALRPVQCGRELIRIGGQGDGGYLLPDDLAGIEYCFSPGVSTVSDFEDHLTSFNIKSFLADYSVERPPIARPEFTFDKKFLGSDNNETHFTLASWKEKYLPNYSDDLLLQMDIEGSEYQVILSTPSELLRQFRILVIEFHFLDRLFDQFVYHQVFKDCFKKLLANFHVVHLHPNNFIGSVSHEGIEIPKMMEVTFYNKNRVSTVKPRTDFPHPLDRDNVAANKPLPLPKIWYAT